MQVKAHTRYALFLLANPTTMTRGKVSKRKKNLVGNMTPPGSELQILSIRSPIKIVLIL